MMDTRPDAVKLDGVERAIIKSRAKLAYDSVQPSDVPAGFAEMARRITANEERRGASRVDPPEQEVEQLADGTFRLSFRPLLQSEQDNATLSLAANMAVADAMLAHKTGLFRVMSEPPALIEPEVGSMKPATMRSVVVLPQPDGPSNASIRPCGTFTLRSATATAEP